MEDWERLYWTKLDGCKMENAIAEILQSQYHGY